MLPRYTSLVLTSLSRHQTNAVEFAAKVWFSLFGGSEVILLLTSGTMGVMQRVVVVTQKLATCIVYRYTYIGRQKLRLLATIVAVHYGSYQRANKYLYIVVDWPFDMLDLHAFFF